MTRKRFPILIACLAVAVACTPAGTRVPDVPTTLDLSTEVIRVDRPGPPQGPEGACWASDITPMVVETVSEQIMVSPARIGPDGAVVTPASFRTETHQRIVQEREEIWFRAPCAEEWTLEFVATLQRALKARGYYLLPVTGALDPQTSDAIHRYQIDHGLDSPRLSLAAARDLGIIAADRDLL